MESQTIFRDYQEQQAADHNDAQDYAKQSLDHLVTDAVTNERRFAGFTAVKTAQAEVQVTPGRFYEIGGGVYFLGTTTTLSMVQYLAAAQRRWLLLSAYGQTVETDIEERDFLIDVNTGATEPQAVATTRSRLGVLNLTPGVESADPIKPALPVGHVPVAFILLDITQVVSIEMQLDYRVVSTDQLDGRTDDLEDFRSNIEPRVSSLASDLAALANKMNTKGQANIILQLMQDMGRVKQALEIPDTAVDYGADRFLTTTESDITNAATLGYDAKVEEGIRFADANQGLVEMDIFSANDPNAAKHSSGLLLPAYDNVMKMGNTILASDLGIAQYGFQTMELTQLSISRQRRRYGGTFVVCSNSAWWQSGTYDSATNTFKKDGETFELVTEWQDAPNHFLYRLRQVWTDTYQEPYWAYTPVSHTITGAQVGQSFLVANDMWATQLDFYLTVKAANENVILSLVEVTTGSPDPGREVMHQSVPHGDLKVNDWTTVTITPTFLKSGKRYAILLTSNANHKIGMSSGQNFLDGTFFYSTDGSYFLGDLTKDMLFRVWGARFRNPQVAIELEALNLDGGILSVDILAGTIMPASTQLIYEVKPAGPGDWVPLDANNLTAFATVPPLVQFRARFVGTRDIMPGLMLSGSRVMVERPKLTFKHVSTLITLATPSDEIYVKLLIENFNDTPHDVTCQLRDVVGATTLNPTVTTESVLPDLPQITGRLERTYKFVPAANRTTMYIIVNGTTNSAASQFNVSERVHWAL